MDRVLASEAKGRGFDPRQPRQLSLSDLIRSVAQSPNCPTSAQINGSWIEQVWRLHLILAVRVMRSLLHRQCGLVKRIARLTADLGGQPNGSLQGEFGQQQF